MSTEVKQPNPQAPADRKQQSPAGKFEGKVVSITGDKLVMANRDGKEYSHALAEDAQVMCDGMPCKAEDLKAGSKIRVTTKERDRNVATCIEALDKNADFAACDGESR
jgi:hypothetical protein